MSRNSGEAQRLLLMDTCGEAAYVALSRGADVVRFEMLPGRMASAAIVGAVKRLLAAEGLRLPELDGVGVVSGPGSFTGVRTGLATAKGLCEAVGLPLGSVSSLELLASAAGLENGFAVLDAGRRSFYVREVGREQTREWIANVAEFEVRAVGTEIVVAEEKTARLLAGFAPKLIELRPADMLPLLRRILADGGTDVAWADANYVRSESEIYTRPRAVEIKSSQR